jgi:hypothetical protein
LEQTTLEQIKVYDGRHKSTSIQTLQNVLEDVPCLSCPESLEVKCDIEGCPKLTAWLIGENEYATN